MLAFSIETARSHAQTSAFVNLWPHLSHQATCGPILGAAAALKPETFWHPVACFPVQPPPAPCALDLLYRVQYGHTARWRPLCKCLCL